MKYLLFFVSLSFYSCTVIDQNRIECIKEYYANIPINQDSKIFDELLEAFIGECLHSDSEIKYYFHDSFEAISYQIKIDTNNKYNKDLVNIYYKIEEALTGLSNNKINTNEISFYYMNNFKKYNSMIPIKCNKNFSVRDGWEISVSIPSLSKDSTICCMVLNLIKCGFGCWAEELLIFYKINNEWKLKAKIILSTGS